MITVVSDGFYDYGILDPRSFAEFPDLASAMQYFRPMLSSPAAVDALRRVLADFGELARRSRSDEDVLREFAGLVAAGRVFVSKLGETMRTVPGKKIEPSPPPPSPTPPTKPPPKEPSDSANVDATDQADTLKRASEDGTPFCEECEKARQKKQEEESAS